MIKTCRNTCNNSKLSRCAQNKAVIVSISSIFLCHLMYLCFTNCPNSCYIWDLPSFSVILHLWRALYTIFIVVTFKGSLCFSATKMPFGCTILMDMLTNIKVSSSDSLLTYECHLRWSTVEWLYTPHTIDKIQSSLVDSFLSFNLNRHPHFLVLDTTCFFFFCDIFTFLILYVLPTPFICMGNSWFPWGSTRIWLLNDNDETIYPANIGRPLT